MKFLEDGLVYNIPDTIRKISKEKIRRTVMNGTKKGRILSGMRPTGRLHIGHLVGVLSNWRKLQDEYECYFEIADWHALTDAYDKTDQLRDNIFNITLDWLATGIDPEKSVLFVQSHVLQHAELHVLFSMLVSLSRLLRVPTFKEKIAELRVSELKHKTKKVLEQSAETAVNSFFEILEQYEQGNLDSASYKAVLKAKLKDAFMESLKDAFTGSEEDLPYGHLVNYGLLGYPILQAADILVYRADHVPIGADQLPHLELTREIARRFNSMYDRVFPVPEPVLTEFPKVPGTDGRKMSKSYGNTIYISDPPNEIEKKIRKAYTDPAKIRKNDPGHPEQCPIFAYHRIFNPDEVPQIEEDCKAGRLGCVACKLNLIKHMNDQLEPIRERRSKYEANPQLVTEILNEGEKKARAEAEATMIKVREAMKLW